MEFVPMKAEHAMLLKNMIGVHADVEISEEIAQNVEEAGGAFTAIDDGEILGIAGISEKWENTGVAWAWLSRKWKRHARRITAEIIYNLSLSKYPRIEMAVRTDYVNGHRWAERLGFELETPVAKKYGPDGRDYSIWVRC